MNKDKLNAFTNKIFDDMAGAMSAGLCYLGHKTGLFNYMAHKGPLTLEQVVAESSLTPRYVEEWLKGMVSAGYIEYEPSQQTYILPEEHAYLLASEGTDHFAGGLFHMVPSSLAVAPRVAEAFHQGGGVSFDEYHEEIVDAIDLINQGNYERRFVSYWIKSIPGLTEKLEQGATALDIGCGVGRVSMTLAKAFPNSRFIGIDSHRASIDKAISLAESSGIITNIQFSTKQLNELDSRQQFDLITLCDCLHDVANPVEILMNIKSKLKPDGVLFIIEPKVADNLEDNINSISTMLYGFSVFHCMTQCLADGGEGLGTCMGPAKAESLVKEAGFNSFEILEIKSQVNLFYLVME